MAVFLIECKESINNWKLVFSSQKWRAIYWRRVLGKVFKLSFEYNNRNTLENQKLWKKTRFRFTFATLFSLSFHFHTIFIYDFRFHFTFTTFSNLTFIFADFSLKIPFSLSFRFHCRYYFISCNFSFKLQKAMFCETFHCIVLMKWVIKNNKYPF